MKRRENTTAGVVIGFDGVNLLCLDCISLKKKQPANEIMIKFSLCNKDDTILVEV